MARFELRNGRFGAYFHDSELSHPKYGGAMDLREVLEKLNQHEALRAAAKAAKRMRDLSALQLHGEGVHDDACSICRAIEDFDAALRAAGILEEEK
jgi:hypothetical protein